MKITGEIIEVYSEYHTIYEYSRIPLISNNWDGELSEYAESPDSWIFL
jgi:hypothetical protein